MATTHNQFSIEQGTSSTRFFRVRLTTDEIVVLTKVCYGLIDAPRRCGSHLSGTRSSWVGAVVDMNHA